MSLKWVPNALTLLRIGAAPLVVFGLYEPGWAGWGALAFIIASTTDWLDGFAARALNATSAFGAKLDLWADKIIVAAPLLGFLLFSHFTTYAAFALVALSGRDLFIMWLRARWPDAQLSASFLAKCKTAVVMVGLAILLLAHWQGTTDLIDKLSLFYGMGWGVVGLGCFMSLYTGWQYVRAVQRSR